MARTYVFTGAAGTGKFNDWTFERDLRDSNGAIIEQTFNWSVYTDGTLQSGSPLDGLYAGDPLPTASDDVIIGPAGGYANFDVVTSANDFYGNGAHAHDLYIRPSSSLTLNNGLTLSHALYNDGTLTVNGYHGYTGSSSGLAVSSGTTTFNGAGLVRMNAFGTASTIFNNVPNSIGYLENNSTIAGGGQIGQSGGYFGSPGAFLVLHNHGTVNADSNLDAIVINPGTTPAVNPVTNDGLLEATGTAGLSFFNTNVVQTPTGTIGAYGSGSFVDLAGATVQGGIIDGSSGGVVQAGYVPTGGNGGSFDNVLDGRSVADGGVGNITITTGGIFRTGSSQVYAEGTITNHGQIQLSPGGSPLRVMANGLTLNGGGQVILQTSNNYFGWLTGPGGSATLHNVDNTISGAGTIGGNGNNASDPSDVILDNQASGTVAGNLSNYSLTINSTTISNAGLLEASGGGALVLNNANVRNQGGTILAADGSHIVLQNSTIVYGGTLSSAGSGYLSIPDASVTLGGASFGPITSNATINISGSLAIAGPFTNSGAISVGGQLYAGATFTGSGNITLVGSGSSVTGGFTDFGNLISGQGAITASIDLEGGGVIEANVSGGALTLSTAQTITNNGLLEASGGTLNVSDAVTGSGYAAVSAGGSLSFSSTFNQAIAFVGANAGTVRLSQAYSGVLVGFAQGDTLDLRNFSYAAGEHLTFLGAGGGSQTYALQTSSGTTVEVLNFSGRYSAGLFGVGDDGSGSVAITLSGAPISSVRHDFNGDGKSDLLWRSTSGSGDIYDWAMNGSQIAASNYISSLAPSSWAALSTADFSGDGKADILWRDTSGNLYDWTMNGAQIAANNYVGALAPSTWSLAGTGDFNGDGKSDLLWSDTAGNLYDWTMNGAQVAANNYVGTLAPSSWTALSTGDFNGDGKSDILWRDTAGNMYDWTMNGSQVASNNYVDTLAPATWTLKATGDFNGDGKSDLLWSDNAGNLYEWMMNGSQIASSAYVGQLAPDQWALASTGDFNGDGKTDLLWQNTTTGDMYDWSMNGPQIASNDFVGTLAPGQWQQLAK